MADAVLTQRLIVGGAAVACLFLVVLAVLALVGAALKVDSILRESRARRYDGPDTLRLLEDTDADITVCVAEDPDLWDLFGPHAPIPDLSGHPDFDPQVGFDRLRQAVRDEQQKGDGRDA
jgi:hypothetical protein